MTDENERAALIQAQFSQWCQPRRGKQNPEILTNCVWAELIENRYSAYKAHETYGSGDKQSPGFCFSRYGQSETTLADGTTIFIAGEYEDFYDPDFYIYNDVIVRSPDGVISIYGYPKDVFPPTDSHSATLVGEDIYIIGCIGYSGQRNYQDTPVYILSIKDFSIRHLKTSGTPPNWLYKHDAKFVSGENAIYCDAGIIKDVEKNETVENIKTWRLCLTTGVWSCTAAKPWTRWRLLREDDEANDLYEMGQVVYAEESSRKDRFSEGYKTKLIAKNYPLDIPAYQARYSPPIDHIIIPNDEYRRHIISIDDVLVRYDESNYDITITVEGSLPENIIAALKAHGLETFSKIEGTPYKIIDL